MEKFEQFKDKEKHIPYKDRAEEISYTNQEKLESKIPYKDKLAINTDLSTIAILSYKAKAVFEILYSQKGPEYRSLHNHLSNITKEMLKSLNLFKSLLEITPKNKKEIESKLKDVGLDIFLDDELRIKPESYKDIYRGSTFLYNETLVRYREQSFNYQYLKEKILKTAKNKDDFLNYISELSAKIFGETVELAKTISFNNVFLEKGFMVLRTAKYDDYRHGVDEVLLDLNKDRENPKIVALIDIKGGTGEPVDEDDLTVAGDVGWNIIKGVNKVIEKIKNRLQKNKRERIIKYGIIEADNKNFKKGPIFEAPIIALPFILSKKTKGAFLRGIENWVKEINNYSQLSVKETKDLKIHLKKVLNQAFVQADKLYFQNEELKEALLKYGTKKEIEMYQDSASLFRNFFEK